ncbi:uncharacterized protein [Lolium perenne]|uniref:uncharacterized protein n=1 Tax=Lolium perenne TaxID=4522 RepID=UPI0021F5C658|nr:uncharacterized protein LOC127313356 [Lolium perenne]
MDEDYLARRHRLSLQLWALLWSHKLPPCTNFRLSVATARQARTQPPNVHKFCQDTSRIGWVGSDGVMEYVTTLPFDGLGDTYIYSETLHLFFQKFYLHLYGKDQMSMKQHSYGDP